MRSRLILAIILILILSGFVQDVKNDVSLNHNFLKGEYLEFKAYYGFLAVGKGSWKIQNSSIQIHNQSNFQVDVYGRTSGFIHFLAPVEDHWKSYVDTSTLVTHLAMRNLQEGKYKKIDITEFFHEDSLIKVKDMDFETGSFKEAQEYKMEGITRGLISGYMHMRTLDFSKLAIGDTITIKSFLDDTFYDLQIICYAREVVETKAGSFKSVVFRPVMPENTIFEGDDSILAWISDDENKIPLKVEAEMFIGHAGIELSSFSGLRSEPALVNN